jgi:hypothetical protein
MVTILFSIFYRTREMIAQLCRYHRTTGRTAHGYQQATIDIDILFPATLTAQRVEDALMILPDQAASNG